MSTTAMSARPALSSFRESVDADGTRTSSFIAVTLVRAIPKRGVDARMDRVRLEVQREADVLSPFGSSLQPARATSGDSGENGEGMREAGAHERMQPRGVTDRVLHCARRLWIAKGGSTLQDRGPASYLAEFIGTLMLVLFICLAVSIFVQQPTAQLPDPFIDWSVIGLVHALHPLRC